MHHGRSGHKFVAALLCALPLLTGCLDYGEELTIDEKGGGSLKIDFIADMNFMSEVAKAIGDEPRPEEMRGPTKEEIQQGLQVEGIKLKELDVQDKDGKTKVHIALDFVSIDALKRIEGFGDDRTIEFFDEGNGKVRVVYSFDTSDLVPVEETEAGAQEDPTEKKIREITQRARDQVKFRAKVRMPGPIERNNGKPVEGDPNAAMWRVDKESDPQRHATFGRGKVRMMMLVPRAKLPFLKDGDLKPLPPKREGAGTEAPPPGGNPSGPPGLGD